MPAGSCQCLYLFICCCAADPVVQLCKNIPYGKHACQAVITAVNQSTDHTIFNATGLLTVCWCEHGMSKCDSPDCASCKQLQASSLAPCYVTHTNALRWKKMVTAHRDVAMDRWSSAAAALRIAEGDKRLRPPCYIMQCDAAHAHFTLYHAGMHATHQFDQAHCGARRAT